MGLIQRNGIEQPWQADTEDTFIVSKMRSAGLIIIGHSKMTQRGFSPIGYNPSKFNGTTRNPINTDYYPGGSSSGTAACIASGLVPFGIGTDGGGSIRIPSSWSGISGLKTTTGRCSLRNCRLSSPLCVTGPMAASTLDLAILYKIISGPDPEWPLGLNQNKVLIPNFTSLPTKVKVGVDWTWAKQSDQAVFDNFKKSLDSLPDMYEVVDITIPGSDYRLD